MNCKHERTGPGTGIDVGEFQVFCRGCNMEFDPQALVDALGFYADFSNWTIHARRTGVFGMEERKDFEIRGELYGGDTARKALGWSNECPTP